MSCAFLISSMNVFVLGLTTAQITGISLSVAVVCAFMAALVVLGLVAIAMRRRKLHGITLPTAEYVASYFTKECNF